MRYTKFAMAIDVKTQKVIASPRMPAELVDSPSFLLKRLGFAAKGRAMDAFEEAGFNPYSFAVLAALDEAAHETQGAVADALGYDRSQMVGILDELEDQGLVERRRDKVDRRRHVVELTADGKRALDEAADADEEARRRVLRPALRRRARGAPRAAPEARPAPRAALRAARADSLVAREPRVDQQVGSPAGFEVHGAQQALARVAATLGDAHRALVAGVDP